MPSRSRAQVQPTGKGREVAGICLLGLGVFCGLSLLSLHAGSGTMMGPGGRATATGLYTLAGAGAYLLVGALLVVAVRVFRGLAWHRSLGELLGICGFIGGSTVLLHLAFGGASGTLHGPGGFLGHWLGDLTTGFIGTVGAALVASSLLMMSLTVLTGVSLGEATGLGVWIAHQGVRALAITARATGRLVVAMFPKKTEREMLDEGGEIPMDAFDEERDHLLELSEADDTVMGPPPELPEPRNHYETTLKGLPVSSVHDQMQEASIRAALPPPDNDEPVRVGRGGRVIELDPDLGFAPTQDAEISMLSLVDDEPSLSSYEEPEPSHTRVPPRRPVSALIAEVAAVECAALAPPPAEVPRGPAPAPPGRHLTAVPPVIVTPVDKPEVRALVEAEPPAVARPRRDEGPGFIRLSEGDFQLPPSDLLVYVPPPAQEIDKKALYDMAARLEQAMSNYGVKGNVSAINMGPVVTMYEFAPAPGTRTGKVAQLENDLAMALEAQAVRIVAPIPGKAVVGVEVPNKNRQMVYLKEILAEEAMRHASKLQIAMGKDIKGNPVSVNLAKMPHLLVAGTTGSGKSVTVNGMITSILYNATPEEVRFIMVDPKMLELSIYEGIPHLLLPVVTDPKKANLALRWAVDEMERRYELLAKSGVRDIATYNAKVDIELGRRSGKEKEKPRPGEKQPAVSQIHAPEAGARAGKRLKVMITGADGAEQEIEVDGGTGQPVDPSVPITEELQEEISAQQAAAQAVAEEQAKEEPLRKLPYIVIVIDEFADLMMVAPKDVETSVARLAQKARAAGLHLILATQRPSVDVITGLIKANFPSRVALQVASKIDSRTILDQPGAETLLGNGDMLFSDRGTKLRRIHGAFLSDDEVHRVVDFLKAQAKPVYDMEILRPRDDEGEEGDGAPVEEFHDALYDQAVAIVCETRQASVSFIQRRLQIGYNRAARMVEQMERDGIVGPANGIKPREVIAPTGDYLSSAP
jgi:S-DNA-T family DNA segregation ATPase FtsK/SpoIIIE